MLGYETDRQVQYYLGIDPDMGGYGSGMDFTEIGDIIHQRIQENLQSAGMLIEAERPVRDPLTGVTGHIDMVANFGNGPEIIEIKSLSRNRMAYWRA